jgi:hypothetical protein
MRGRQVRALSRKADVLRITVKTVEEANRLMARIAADEALGDGSHRTAKMAEVWGPITESTDSAGLPLSMRQVFRQIDEDFMGVTHDGHLIAWGPKRPMPGTDMSWRELIVIRPNR